MPFTPDEPVQLKQVGRNSFELLEGFAYTDTRGRVHEIDPMSVGETDLASVPWILWWFVASYGRHTRAALVHDQLVDQIERHDADTVFRGALKENGVRWVRRWLIWSTVSYETTFRTFGMPLDPTKSNGARQQRKGRLVTVIGFLAVFLHALLTLDFALWAIGEHRLLQALAIVAVVSWFLVWGVRRGLGLLAGLVLIVPAMVVLLIPLLVVWILEGGLWWLVKVAIWFFTDRRQGEDRPLGPGLGPTRYGGLAQV